MRSYMAYVQGKRRKNPFPALLWSLFFVPASWVAGLWISLTDFLYRHGLKRITEPSIPVISLGNLTYGGTNKTPFVEMLCRMIKSRGVPVGIVSRGYGGREADARVITGGEFEGGSGRADRLAVGDEPLLLSARLPDVLVAVSRDRMRGLEELERRGVRLAVADDAFQHRKVVRDADVVLIDAACPFGNGRVIPAGVLREPPRALRRAHLVVLTKADQASAEELIALREKLTEFVPEERIFTARLAVVEWALWRRDPAGFRPFVEDVQGLRVMAFSAIGNPASFVRTLEQKGVRVAGERHFRDHHSYSVLDMEVLSRQMAVCGAEFLACTEKDIYNLPPRWGTEAEEVPPLLVPRVVTALDEPERFFTALINCLRPQVVVASNGYGEDAIGVLLAKKLRAAFPSAEVLSFPLVGRGEPYKAQGFPVASTPSVTPSGGVVKYRLRDLWGDIRAGLFGHIRDQQGAWRGLAHQVRTPVCVGDVYLLLHTVWGQGIAPLFVATAKTVYLSGHWRLERFIIRRHCRRAWTRDHDSATQLTASGADALYSGSPIMDLLGDKPPEDLFPAHPGRPKVLLLPGSRARAYEDVRFLLDAVEILQSRKPCDYVMVLAPTISPERLMASCGGWHGEESFSLTKGDTSIRLHRGGVPEAAVGSRLLIGLGGTANQLCAGMGIPVLSIDEKGKRVQKKLLEDSEILVKPTPDALASAALKILTTPELHEKMAQAGRARMGSPGALDDVVRYVAVKLGWSVRCEVWEKLREGRNATVFSRL